MPTPQELQNLGQRAAISLIKEMRFLGKLKNEEKLNELLDLPRRDELGFQVIKGKDAAKSDQAKGNFSAELVGLRFCIADGEVQRVNMMDIDHTVPFKYIYAKQEALLSYLNDPNNTGFTEGFLKATASIDSKKISISDYFGRNAANGVVQGTRRFFRLCYNDIDNLLLICHACNIQKGASDSLEWFRKQEPFLGEHFVKAVNEAGGLHDGIIVKKVCKATSDPGDILKIGEFNCRLHDGEGKGLGEFVNDWFESENPGYAQDVVEAYKSIWLELKEIYELQLRSKTSDDEKRRKDTQVASIKLTSMIEAQIKVIEERYQLTTTADVNIPSQSSHSSGDDSIDCKGRIDEVNYKIKQVLSYMHGLKKIQAIIAANDYAIATRENKIELYSYYRTLGIRELDLQKQEKFFNEIVAILQKHYSEKQKFSIDDIKQTIKEVAKKYSLSLQLEEALTREAEKDKEIVRLRTELENEKKRSRPQSDICDNAKSPNKDRPRSPRF